MKFREWFLMEEVIDNELVDRIRAGDATAWNDLIRRWEPRIRGILHKITSNRSDIDEITQESLMRVFQAVQRGDEIRHFPTWVISVVKNTMSSFFRKHRPQTAGDLEALQLRQGGKRRSGDVLANIDNPTFDNVLSGELSDLIDKAIDALASSQDEFDQRRAEVLRLRSKGMPFKKIAEKLKINYITAKRIGMEGRRAIAASLGLDQAED